MARMKLLTESHHRARAEKATRLGTEMKGGWILKARSLERAADILWLTIENDLILLQQDKDPPSWDSVTGPYLLLAALSVENYLKAICISNHGAFTDNGKFKFGHHNLLQLAEDCSLHCSVEELELLERLEYHLVFAGRYPAPKKPEMLLPRVRSDGSWGSLSFLSSLDQQRIKSLTEKLRQAVEA